MEDALIGHTGFVGSNLAGQHEFQGCFNRKNITEIAGGRFDLLVCSAMPAAKWVANSRPWDDRANFDRLLGCLRRAEAEQVVVISTVDVYPEPVGVDEDSPINPLAQQPYGKHRHMLEQALRAHFPRVLVLRLGGLFGSGLKKNAVYDLLHNNMLDKIDANGVFQFYCLDHLWADIQKGLAEGLELLNVATEPFSIRDMSKEAFGIDFNNRLPTPPPRYDFRSKHAAAWGGRDGYLYLRDQVMNELRDFVARERAGTT
jgi:nucleoside-diphosphate-sugar epimerase